MISYFLPHQVGWLSRPAIPDFKSSGVMVVNIYNKKVYIDLQEIHNSKIISTISGE
jgi:hypothetical protein